MQITLEVTSQNAYNKLLAYIQKEDIRLLPLTLPTSVLQGEARKEALQWLKNYENKNSTPIEIWDEYLKECRTDKPIEGRE